MFNADKSIAWSVILLGIATWSAFSFYWTGYYNGKRLNQNEITKQQREIAKLQEQINVLESNSLVVEMPRSVKASSVQF